VTIPKTIVINFRSVNMKVYFDQNKRDNIVKRLLVTSDKHHQILNP